MTSKTNKYRALILTGFHRSATSAAANYVFNAGLNMGYDLMRANINNPRGYFEDIPAVKLHENEFKKAGTNWQFHDEVILKAENKFLTDYITIRNEKDLFWGIKDPRACLFLDDWHKALGNNGCFFFVIRHWSSCIESLLNRHSKNLAHGLTEVSPDSNDIKFWLQPDLAAKMWLSYNKRLLSFAKENPNITLISTQRALFEGAKVLEAINHKFSFTLDIEAKSPFDHSLFRDLTSDTIFEQISYSLQQELNHVWSNLLKYATFTTENEEANITNSTMVSTFNLEKIQTQIRKYAESTASKPITSIENDNVWLPNLLKLDNFNELVTFLNTSKPQSLSGIQTEDWLQVIEEKFIGNTDVLLSIAKLMMRMSEYKLAIQQLDKINNLGASSPYIDMFSAQCYQKLNDFTLSESLFKNIIKAKPNKAIFHTNYSILLAEIGNTELAEHHFKLAYQLEAKNPGCLLSYCKFLDGTCRTNKAIELLRVFLENAFHPMIDILLKRYESKVNNELMLDRYYESTKKKVNETNLHKWLAKSCSLLNYRSAETDLINRCFSHWGKMQPPPFFLGLMTRCKDEYFISEFVQYYINEGVDFIYIIDDNSNNKDIYNDIIDNPKVKVIFENNIIQNNYASKLYKSVKHLYEWMIYLDVDEFIAPKRNILSNIRNELKTHFSNVDCIKVPWVMMSSNNIKKSPASVLKNNVWRWNHDKKHHSDIHKFRCRYEEIEVKCIFKTSQYDDITDHHPKSGQQGLSVVDSVSNRMAVLDPFHPTLRESDISNAIFVCHHFRIISQENNLHKLKTNHWYIKKEYQLADITSSDHAEIFDNSLSVRSFKKKIFIVGFNRCGTRTLHYFFKDNGLPSIHWDNDNLVKTMESNLMSSNKLLANGRTVNCKVNSDCLYENAQVFSDMTLHQLNKDAKDYYKTLDQHYPGSIFILNTRNVDDWIASRKKHSNGRIVQQLCSFHDCATEEIEELWREMWWSTIDEIKSYFSDRDSDLLIFDIDNDGVEKITSFFEEDVILDSTHYQYVK